MLRTSWRWAKSTFNDTQLRLYHPRRFSHVQLTITRTIMPANHKMALSQSPTCFPTLPAYLFRQTSQYLSDGIRGDHRRFFHELALGKAPESAKAT
ncbi:hypothetical protein LZ30DRAFT_706745 [Colletotrichum cereale]|nr:hypothetical protein LZ30DRAFT_706745 [Colletotrichum cereale]